MKTVLMLIGLIFLFGCGDSSLPEEDWYGTWYFVDNPKNIISFHEDGMITTDFIATTLTDLNNLDSSIPIPPEVRANEFEFNQLLREFRMSMNAGTYSVEKDRYTMNIFDEYDAGRWTIKGDTLTLYSDVHQTAKLKRYVL